jgi:hypothetical protein
MALTPSGAISLGNINTALNRSATAPISMNDSQVRFLANQDTGSVTMNSMRNRYNNNGTITVDINEGKFNTTYFSSAISGGFFDGLMISMSTTEGSTFNVTETFGSYDPPVASVPSPVPTLRLKVGNRAAITMPTSGTSVGNNYWASLDQFAMGPEQVGQTLTWQWSSI